MLLALLAAPSVVVQRAESVRVPPRLHVYGGNGFGYGTAGLGAAIHAGVDGRRWGAALRATFHGDAFSGSDYVETYGLLVSRTARLGRHRYARAGAGPTLVREVDGPGFFSDDHERRVRTTLGVDAGAALGVLFLYVLHVEAHALAGFNAFQSHVGVAVSGGLRLPIR